MDSPSNTDEDLKTQNEGKPLEDSPTSDLSDTANKDAEDSSNSETPEEDQSTFDVVMDAIKEDGEDEGDKESSSSEDGSNESDDKSEEGESEGSKEKSDEFEDFSPEERAKLKKSTAERFDKLKNLYHESKEKTKDLETQLEKASVGAANYDGFVGFLNENRISEDEANELFNIGALMKNDPVKALELITPHYNNLLHITGNVIPDDLQQQVAQGYITKDHALELSRHRASGQTTQAISQERQQHQQQQEISRQQQTQASIQSAIADWEKKWSSSDPDYSTKKDRVLERVELTLVRAARDGKLPQSVNEAVDIANQAKADVEAELKQFQTRKPVTTVDGGGSSTSMPEPNNTQDVIRRALNV